MRWVVAAPLLLVVACTTFDPSGYADAAGMPADVQRFIVQWQDCSHWLGEPAWDDARRRQIDRAVHDVCPGVDARGRRVRARHAAEPEILSRIASYEVLGQ